MPAHHAAEDAEASQLPLVLCTPFIVSIRGPGHPSAHLVAAVMCQRHWPACCSPKNPKGSLAKQVLQSSLSLFLQSWRQNRRSALKQLHETLAFWTDGVGGAWLLGWQVTPLTLRNVTSTWRDPRGACQKKLCNLTRPYDTGVYSTSPERLPTTLH